MVFYLDIISYRGSCVTVGGNLFLRHTPNDIIGHSGGNGRATCGGSEFIRSVVLLFLVLYRVFKS